MTYARNIVIFLFNRTKLKSKIGKNRCEVKTKFPWIVAKSLLKGAQKRSGCVSKYGGSFPRHVSEGIGYILFVPTSVSACLFYATEREFPSISFSPRKYSFNGKKLHASIFNLRFFGASLRICFRSIEHSFSPTH